MKRYVTQEEKAERLKKVLNYEMYSSGENQPYSWLRVISFVPKESHLGTKIPMLSWAYKGRRHIYGPPGEPPITKYKWFTEAEYTFMKLKGWL